jgi:hypothetical protein
VSGRWDLRGATVGLLLVGSGLALLARDDAVLDALPWLAVVAVAACAALALALSRLDQALRRRP